MELSEIFAWDIDFNTAIQRGDTFRVAVEKLYLDGELRRYGKVLAAEFVNSGRTLRAVRFEGKDGTAAYYEPSGEPLKKAFLKSPLRFTRVSSSFSRGRFHPVLHVTRAHNGTDLAAGHGTPVRAIGHGTVVDRRIPGRLRKARRGAARQRLHQLLRPPVEDPGARRPAGFAERPRWAWSAPPVSPPVRIFTTAS